MKKTILFLPVLIIQIFSYAQPVVTGDWSGHLQVQGMKVKIVFHIRDKEGKLTSTFDSPDQNAMNLPVDQTTVTDTMITLDAHSLGILYKGVPSVHRDSITGNWQQSGRKFPLVLVKDTSQKAMCVKDPDETELVLATPTGDIIGTLLYPAGMEKAPVVLIIAGSGPTDRDGNSPPALGNKSNCYKLLAQGLHANGIASLRYDKRGVGSSVLAGLKEENLRFDTYVDDAIGWIRLLSKDPRFSTIIIAGHSEGSLIGMIACNKEKTGGFISISGAGRPADVILKEQLKDLPEDKKPTIFAVIDKLKKGDTTSNVPPAAYNLLGPSVQPYMISWFRYDPAKECSSLKIPVMILQGEMDIQVTVKDAELLSKANPKAELKLIPRMNHVLKDTDTKDKAEQISKVYSSPSLPLDKEFTESVILFIRDLQ